MIFNFSGAVLIFIFILFLMCLALFANFNVEIVSFVLALWGEQVTINDVL